jgi:hypothetical protein
VFVFKSNNNEIRNIFTSDLGYKNLLLSLAKRLRML